MTNTNGLLAGTSKTGILSVWFSQTLHLRHHNGLSTLSRSHQNPTAHPHQQWLFSVAFSLVASPSPPNYCASSRENKGRQKSFLGSLLWSPRWKMKSVLQMSRVIHCCSPEIRTPVCISPSLECLNQ